MSRGVLSQTHLENFAAADDEHDHTRYHWLDMNSVHVNIRSSRRRFCRLDRPLSSHPRLFSVSSSLASTKSQAPITLASFKKPFFKVFLGAVLTYQILYYGWLRLEVEETQADKKQLLADLQNTVKQLAPDQA